MRQRKEHSESTRFWPYLVVVFILALIGTSGIVGYIEYHQLQLDRERSGGYAILQAKRLQNAIESQLYTAKTVEALLVQGNGEIQDFDSAMEEIMSGLHINNISLAPGGVITQTYPIEGNEETIGHDVLNDPKRAMESNEAMKSKKLTVSGPYELKQGGTGIIGRCPIYMEDSDEEERFWGFVCITLKFPDAFEDAELEQMEEQDYSYECWRIMPETGEKQMIVKSVSPLGRLPVDYQFELLNSKWTLSITPARGWVNYVTLMLREAFALLTTLLVTLLAWYVMRLAKSRNNLDRIIRQQTENYRRINQLNAQVTVFRHDMKNHVVSILGLITAERIQEAREYIETMDGRFLPGAVIFNTENYVFDALLAEKRALASERKITMDCEILLNRTLKIESIDWSILYGNLLDNALEAAVKTEHPYVSISMSCRGNILHTKISNTSAGRPQMDNGRYVTSKKNRESHGIGFGQIQKCIRKYDGSLETDYENGVFSVSFILLNV